MMGAVSSQTFPSAPPITEENCPSLQDRVVVVTGATSGCGYELVKILYQKNATVYLSARSDAKGQKTVNDVRAAFPQSTGKVDYFVLEYDDITKVRQGADSLKAKEKHIDVLYNNAGIAAGAAGARSAQGIDIHFAVNNLGPFLFTNYVLSELKAGHNPRVVWSSSMIVDANPIKGGLVMHELDHPSPDQPRNYAISKVGNWFLGSEFAKRYATAGIISVIENPGNLKTPIWKDQSKLLVSMMSPILKPPKFGAYTMLYAGFSPDVDVSRNGAFIIPWGRFHPKPREDILLALKSEAEGGTGLAEQFWGWCESKCPGI